MKVLKIGATWCPGCIIMKPRWKKIEEENPWLETEYYDFDKDEEIMEKYGVNDVLPVFIFLDKNGEEFLRLKGEVSEEELLRILNENKHK
jgi:thiol-disulfide isomerase/thioredoxin